MLDWEGNFLSALDRLWRGGGIVSVVLFIIAYVIYGSQPKVGASAVELSSFYDGNRTRILIATIILGFAVLFLMWFAAALSTVLRDAGQGTWATAATAASAALGAVFFVWRWLWIVGRAVTIIVVSKSTIKVPRQVTISVITLLVRSTSLIIPSNLSRVYSLYVHVFHKKTLRPAKNRLEMDYLAKALTAGSSVSSAY